MRPAALALALALALTLLAGEAVAQRTDFAAIPPQQQQAYVKGIQEELAIHGYDPGTADGVAGPRTRQAIREYQRDAGLAVDGQPSVELLNHLKFALPKVTKQRAAAGAQGSVITQIQQELARRGYDPGPADGRSGPRTRAAALAFRADAKLAEGPLDAAFLTQIKNADPAIRRR
jgi:peptidoglycan hydrolase-like protein with peptidoglycan-binding domain